jgi:imidazolonepropionase-like amidohydrolase
MHRRLRTIGILSAALTAAGAAGQTQTRSVDPVTLSNARVVDVRTGQIQEGMTLVLREGKIASLGRSAAAGSGARVIDLQGQYVVPGLIDSHAHIGNLDGARRALLSGVTTARSAATAMYADVAISELVNKGILAGPDIIPAGVHVLPQLGEDILADPRLGDFADGVKTLEDIRRVVRVNLDRGARVIKTSATARAGTADTDPRTTTFREAELRAIVEEAGARNVPVEVHAHGDEGAMLAVKAGVRSIEHGTYLSDATLKLMKEKGTFFVPTYTTVVDIAEPGGDYDVAALRIRGQHMLPQLRRVIGHAHAMGVKIATGVDTEYGPQSLGRIAHEILHLTECGLTPLAALQAATITGADLVGLQARIGEIKEGFDADLLVIGANPLDAIDVLQDPLMIVSNGRVVLDRVSQPTASSPSSSGR